MPKQNGSGNAGHGGHTGTVPETETKTFKTAAAAANWLAAKGSYKMMDACGDVGLVLTSNRVTKVIYVGPCA